MTKQSLFAATAIAALITLSACAPAYSPKENQSMKNIVQVAAVQAAGLAETLAGPGPFTVFAPTDAAFAKLPAGTVEALLADKEKLASILTYHVVSGKVVASDITRMNGAMPVTVNGQKLDITLRGGNVYVNGAQVTTADVYASNGVIHVIDGVVLPKAEPAMSGR